MATIEERLRELEINHAQLQADFNKLNEHVKMDIDMSIPSTRDYTVNYDYVGRIDVASSGGPYDSLQEQSTHCRD